MSRRMYTFFIKLNKLTRVGKLPAKKLQFGNALNEFEEHDRQRGLWFRMLSVIRSSVQYL